MELFSAMEQRYSCRKYDTKPVEQEKVQKCLEAARLSPSACNSQPTHYIEVKDDEIKAKVCDLVPMPFLKQAPTMMVLVEDEISLIPAVSKVFGDQFFAQIDVGISAAHFCLAATDLGLATCMVGWLEKAEELKQILGITKGEIRLIISLGYALDELKPKKRKEIAEMYDIK